jgi:hypothetical protein
VIALILALGSPLRAFAHGGSRAPESKFVIHIYLLANRAISGIEAGKLEIRPGLSNALKAMSRIAPQFMLKQMAKMAKPQVVSRPPTKGVLTLS